MELAKSKLYTEEDYYSLAENIRAELIDGDLIYNQTDLSRESVWVYYFEESKLKLRLILLRMKLRLIFTMICI